MLACDFKHAFVEKLFVAQQVENPLLGNLVLDRTDFITFDGPTSMTIQQMEVVDILDNKRED